MERRLAAILAADVVGYARLIRVDEEGTLAAFRALRAELADPHLGAHQGRTVKLMGDGMLVEFASVVGAVRAAAAIQQALAERNAGSAQDGRIELRIGINLGDVVIDGDDIHGDGVNLAARLEGIAAPGGLCISEAVYEQVRDRLDFVFEDLGLKEVKNIDRPLRAWHWHPDRTSATEPATPAGAPLPPPDKPSIAVLPFDNMSGDQEQDYFADGITEDIITEISKIHGLMVISRNSTFTYKGKAVKAQDVCSDLGVRYILEGSVRKAGERVRITAQLIDGPTGGHLWAERYDRGLADIFAVQDDVTERIVRSLEVRLAAEDRSSRVETDNPEAYDCILRGREQYRLYSKEGNAAARRLYERAIELDPRYAAAHAAMAETCMHDWFGGDPAALERAFALAQTAKGLDPSLPLVYEALSSIHLFKRQHDEALAAARRWLEIEPNSADAYANQAGMMHFGGEPERVEGLIEKAKRLNPFYPFYYTLYVGQARFTMRRFSEAAAIIKRSIAHNPESLPSQFYLAACYGQMGELALARDALAEARRISPDLSTARVRAIAAYRRPGDVDLLIDGLRKAGMLE